MLACFAPADAAARSVRVVTAAGFADWLAAAEPAVRDWLAGSGFKAKPGATALIPGGGAVLTVSAPAEPWDAAALQAALPGRRLAPRRPGRAPSARPCRPGLGAGRLSLHPLPRRRDRAAAPRAPRRTWRRPRPASGGGDLAGARPGQHAGERPRPGRAGRGRGGGGYRLPGRVPGDRRRRPARGQLSRGPCRGPRQRPGAAPGRSALGRSCGTQGDAGRQGCVLRHWRPRHQAVQRHG